MRFSFGRDATSITFPVPWIVVAGLFGFSVADAQIIQTQIFKNTQSITIRDTNTALPYPSTINVTGTTGTLLRVSITLSNLAHTYPDDIDMLLVSPGGTKVKIMSDAGGSPPVTNLSFTLDSVAATPLSDVGPLVSGTFAPADFANFDGGSVDTFASPAPTGPYETNLTVFTGIPANGDWKLYVVDDQGRDTGSIARGWSLSMTISNYIAPPTITSQPQARVGKECGSTLFSVTAAGAVPLTYQWRFNGTNLPGATQSNLVLIDLDSGDVGDYSVLVSNVGGFVISSNALLTIIPISQGSDLITDATPICPADLDWFHTSGSVSTSDPIGPIFNPVVWWSIKPAFNQTIYLDTTGSSIDSAISVYRVSSGSFVFVGGRPNRQFPQLGDFSAFLSVPLSAGQTYYVGVYSENGFPGSYQLFAQRAQSASGGFNVSGVTSGGVMTNGNSLDVYIDAYGLISFANLRLFDRGTLIYQRDQQEVNGASQHFYWPSPPPGVHSLTLEIASLGVTNISGPFDFLVVGKEIGFDRFDAFPPQATNSGTLISGTLVVRNNSPSATGPLRVRCVLGATAYERQTVPSPPPAETLIPSFPPTTPVSQGGTLPAGSIWAVPITRQMAVICPFYAGGFTYPGLQYHIYAILEENQSGQWIVVDRAKLFSSVPVVLSPPNEGQNGQDGGVNYDLFTYAQPPLMLEGPASFYENNSTSVVARVRLSNNTTNVVAPAWSVNPPFSIDATGMLTAPPLAANSNALVTASYTHTIQTLSSSRNITVLKLPTPEVLWLQSPQAISGRFKATINGAANTSYQIFSGTNATSLSLLQSVTTDSQGKALLDVPITNAAGVRFFKAQRPFP